ncbi:MAG TPA: hemerythrin domain-containing protein [Longimicrobiales bacterium]|nr:hemerythrin domain-containing protein [Longimicrobiales bacterium]
MPPLRSATIRTTLFLAASVALARPAPAQQTTRPEADMSHAHSSAPEIEIPESLRAEHREIHAALERATKTPGRVGEAARELAKVLHPHFQREEEIALPPLGLLAPLARGEFSAAMLGVLPMTDSLRAELPRMLQEHVAIHAATIRLGEVARAEHNAPVAHLAEQLAAHAKSEEELFYPAAVLVGEIVRARSSPHGERGPGME